MEAAVSNSNDLKLTWNRSTVVSLKKYTKDSRCIKESCSTAEERRGWCWRSPVPRAPSRALKLLPVFILTVLSSEGLKMWKVQRDSRRAEREDEVFLVASPSALWRPAGSVCTGPADPRCYCGSAQTEKHSVLWHGLLPGPAGHQLWTNSLTSCVRWDRSSAVTWLVVVGWGNVQWDPATCWEEEEEEEEAVYIIF